MAKFPTEVEKSVTVKVPLATAYEYLWDVVGSSGCVPGLDSCKPSGGKHTYRFVFEERSTGPVSLVAVYTARYEGNGKDRITFEGTNADGDNTDVKGTIRLEAKGDSTRIVLKQMIAPDTPVPRLLQGLIRGFVENEAAESVKAYLANVKATLERA